VQYLSVVTVLQPKAHLGADIEDFVFVKGALLFGSFINLLSQIAVISVLHDDIMKHVFVLEVTVVPDDVRMIQALENSTFFLNFHSLIMRYFFHIYLFEDPDLLCLFRLDEVCLSSATLTQSLQLAKLFFLRPCRRFADVPSRL